MNSLSMGFFILLVFVFFGVLASSNVVDMMAAAKRLRTKLMTETPFGTFERMASSEIWNTRGANDRSSVEIQIRDVEGVPDPDLVAHIPHVISQRSRLEGVAREFIFTAEPAYSNANLELSNIQICEGAATLLLSFLYRGDGYPPNCRLEVEVQNGHPHRVYIDKQVLEAR